MKYTPKVGQKCKTFGVRFKLVDFYSSLFYAKNKHFLTVFRGFFNAVFARFSTQGVSFYAKS